MVNSLFYLPDGQDGFVPVIAAFSRMRSPRMPWYDAIR
jgi:hypothetical protein